MNEIYKITLGFIIGVAFTLLVLLPFTGARNPALIELKDELAKSERLITELRNDNNRLNEGQRRITEDLENAVTTAGELRSRNSELESIVQRTGEELARAVGEARSLTELIESIIATVDHLLTQN